MKAIPGAIAGVLILAATADAATIFRLFLTDGTDVVSYGEYVRLEDRVVFSTPAGGSADQPRLHVVTLPATLIDWERTDRYAASARYQQYAATRGEEDFALLSNEVARVLNEIALSPDRDRALALAEQARRVLVEWPRQHYGYRQDDVREIVALLDESINALKGQVGGASFELSLVATAPPIPLEPVRGMPDAAEQLNGLLRMAALADAVPDRVALLQSSLTLLDEASTAAPLVNAAAIRRSIERQLRDEAAIDQRYLRFAERLTGEAARAAAEARVQEVERILGHIAREDERLGRRRPELVQALRTSVEVQLDSARRLRLLRDRWEIRRSAYRDYQRAINGFLLQLARVRPGLEAIRRLEGPAPDALLALRTRLTGGVDRLERLSTPEELRPTHELLIGAWRFAQSAVNGRYDAVVAADVGAAWEASSAAAGALMLLSRVQEDVAAMLAPPTLQ